jgi:hypothetical protein
MSARVAPLGDPAGSTAPCDDPEGRSAREARARPFRVQGDPSLPVPRSERLRRPPSPKSAHRPSPSRSPGASQSMCLTGDTPGLQYGGGPNLRPPGPQSVLKPPVIGGFSKNSGLSACGPNPGVCSQNVTPQRPMGSACHAEGRGFESHQPLRKAPLMRGFFVPGDLELGVRPTTSSRYRSRAAVCGQRLIAGPNPTDWCIPRKPPVNPPPTSALDVRPSRWLSIPASLRTTPITSASRWTGWGLTACGLPNPD